MPLTPGGASGVRAMIMWQMLSAASWSPHVMKIFWPESRYPPLPSGRAIEVRAARSEPACGSVRHMAPVHSPETSRGRTRRFCRSVPCRASASMAPWVSMGQRPKAMLAAWTISNTASSIALERPWPPCSGSALSEFQPCSTKWR